MVERETPLFYGLQSHMSTPSILIVDDKQDLLDLFSASLRRLPYRLITAQSGDIALAILKQETPALILLDIAMPHTSGLDVLHEVRQVSRLDATRIIIVTAVPSRIERDDMQLFDKLIAKPITPRALEQAVLEVLNS